MKIIIAEDNENLRELYVRVIKSAVDGIGIREVGDGKDLVDKVREQYGNYDLIITDNKMPLMCGLEAIKEIRKDYPNIPICMISSAVPVEEMQKKAVEAGATKYIAKTPNISKDLVGFVEKYQTDESHESENL